MNLKLIYNRIAKGKKDGDMFAGAAISIFVAALFCVIISFGYVSWEREFAAGDDIDHIATSYIKKMETVGYLDDGAKVQLIEELEKAGMINPDVITGTTRRQALYGEKITLRITGNLKIKNILSFSTSLKMEDKSFNVDVIKSGTSKF